MGKKNYEKIQFFFTRPQKMSQPHIFITKNTEAKIWLFFCLSYDTVTLEHFTTREYSRIMNEQVKQRTLSAKGEQIP